MHKRNYIFQFSLILWVSLVMVCQQTIADGAERITFEHIGLEQGLSHNTILSIAQDSLGVMWFGTRNGLNKYDGNRVTPYYANPKNRNSLPENQIKRLKANGDKLWIQTFSAISCYDIVKERFENCTVIGIKSFEVDDDFIWIGTSNGLYKLKWGTDNFTRIETGLASDIEYNALLDTPLGLIVGTSNGVYCRLSDGEMRPLVYDIACTGLFLDSKGVIWAGSISDGAFRIESFKKVDHFGRDVLLHDFVRCISEDDQGNIWLGTLLGLNRLDASTGTVNSYIYDEDDPTQLSHSSIWTICKDRSGNLWIGTFFGGVNIFHPTNFLFRYYPVNTSNNKGLNFRVVGAMCEDKAGDLWICTEGGGLNHYDRRTEKFTYYTHKPEDSSSISCNNAKSIINQGDTILWIATHTGGLNRFDMRKKTFSTLQNLPSHKKYIPNNDILQIIHYGDRYFLATHTGVMLFDPHTGEVKQALPDEFHTRVSQNVRSVMYDGNNLWIGTEFQGLARYTIATNEFKQYLLGSYNSGGISSNTINSLYCDKRGNIWLATPNGLERYREESDDFEHFLFSDALPNNHILNIAGTDSDNLLFTTNRGISIFNHQEKRFTSYTQDNGLPLSEVNVNGLFVNTSGDVFVGGLNGMVSFRADDLLQPNPTNRIMVTNLNVNGRDIVSIDNPKIIPQNIMMCNRIDMFPEHSIFSLSFSDMSLTKSNKQKLAYKLEGFDKEWIVADASNKATYTNLSPGTYTFRVKHLPVNEGSDTEASVKVKVHPPFYRSWFAFVLYAVAIALLVFYLNRMYLLRRRAEYELSINEAERQREAEYNQSKLRFFTNVSHEFRTPLTLIVGQLEFLLENRQLPPAIYKRILSASKSTRRLQSMINELLDFRKQEGGYDNILVGEQDINQFLYEIFDSYIELAENSGMKYLFEGSNTPVMIWFDRKLMEKVFYNLISNAFKFTEKKGSIHVSLKEDAGMVFIEIQDTGIGIPKESIDKVFDRFYQAKNSFENKNISMQGTGLGLALAKHIIDIHGGSIVVESEVGKGSRFIVSLLKGDQHFLSDQKMKTIDLAENTVTNTDDDIVSIKNSLPQVKERNSYTVLIVEDNDEMRDFLQDILSSFCAVETASDGEKGFEMALKLQPQLVLSDVMMPRMSGTELCVKLKKNIATSHIPVVLLTARTATDHKIEGLQTGADDYITKPFSIKLLVARIENIINNRRLLQIKYSKDPDADISKLTLNDIDSAFIDKAQQFVLKNIDNSDYSVNDFASDMGMGRSAFFSKIKGVTGQTPNDFTLSIKLKRAVSLMYENPTITVSEVAYKSGFSSQQYFNTCFKKHYGMPAGQYLQNKFGKR